MPDPRLKIDGAGFVLPVDPEMEIIRDGSIAIEGRMRPGTGVSLPER